MKKTRLFIAIISIIIILAYIATTIIGALLPRGKGAELKEHKETLNEVQSDTKYSSDIDRTDTVRTEQEDEIDEDEEEYQSEENLPQENNSEKIDDINQSQENTDEISQEITGEYGRLNFEDLDKLDNTKYSWWISQNNEYKTPGIPEIAEDLISKYDGIFTGDTSQKSIYLTFDEGYENGYTPIILDVLKKNEVKSIFFVTGSYIEKNPELIKRMLQEGHKVGNHTINHPSLPEIDNAQLERELVGLEERFYELYGERFEYMRPPMGEYSERALAAAQQLGYKTVFWSFAYKDYDVNDQKGQEYAYNKIMSNLHNGAVLLLHAVSKDNAEVLDKLIKDIRAQGYEIKPFDL